MLGLSGSSGTSSSSDSMAAAEARVTAWVTAAPAQPATQTVAPTLTATTSLAAPTAAAPGMTPTAKGAAAPYPMLPYMGTMHGAAGGELADFLQGKERAEQALADIEAAYIAAAKEKGFL